MKLIRMANEDFENYISNAKIEYANDKIQAGTWSKEEAIQNSEDSFNRLLPDGLKTDNHYLYSILDPSNSLKIGYIWFEFSQKLSGRVAFIYDFIIFEEYRSKGFGKNSMIAIEEEAKKLDIDEISLHVFGHNEKAIHLYKKMGYLVTDIQMSKKIKNG